MSKGNIFEEYHSVRETIFKNKDIYEQCYFDLLQSIETYFQSYKWIKNDRERYIYWYSDRKISTGKAASLIGMNENTYRSMISRVSKRLRGILFDGSHLQDVCLSSNRELIRWTKKHINYLNISFDLYHELPSYLLKKIEDIVAESVAVGNGKAESTEETIGEINEQEMFQALFFVCSFSESLMEAKLSVVKPLALKKVMDELTSGDYSEWVEYYQVIKQILVQKNFVNSKAIEIIKSRADR